MAERLEKPLMARVELGYMYDDEVPLKINYQVKGSLKKSWWERIDFSVGMVRGAVVTVLLISLLK